MPAASGRYYAKITNAITRKLTLYTDTVDYTAPLAKTTVTISVYPNPVKGLLTINGLDAKSTSKITITDVSGNVWMNIITRNQSTAKYDVSKLKPGNYLLNVSNGQEMKTLNFMKE